MTLRLPPNSVVRILHLNSARAFGGGERHLADLARALQARGHEVYAAIRPGSPLREALASLPTHNLYTLPLRNALDLASASKLARFMREHKIEILHAHVARDYPLAAFAVELAGATAQLILTRHLLFPLNRLHALTLRRVKRVIAVSESVARVLGEQRIFPPHKIRVVLNGIDIHRFQFLTRDFDRESYRRHTLRSRAPLLVGIAGELRPHKGQEDFVRAAASIARSDIDVDFVIVGEDASEKREYRTQIEQLIVELKLEGRVHLMGWLEDVPPLFSALDIFVSASRIEPFGLVMAEAMAGGATVVATATGGAREIIDDGVTGRLVPIGDAKALAKTITELLKDVDERKRLSTNAQKVVCERFGLDRMVAETEQIYREALERKAVL